MPRSPFSSNQGGASSPPRGGTTTRHNPQGRPLPWQSPALLDLHRQQRTSTSPKPTKERPKTAAERAPAAEPMEELQAADLLQAASRGLLARNSCAAARMEGAGQRTERTLERAERTVVSRAKSNGGPR